MATMADQEDADGFPIVQRGRARSRSFMEEDEEEAGNSDKIVARAQAAAAAGGAGGSNSGSAGPRQGGSVI